MGLTRFSLLFTLLGVSVFVGCRPPLDDAEPVAVRMAHLEGADPKLAVFLEQANESFYMNRVTEDAFQRVVAATRSPNPRTRDNAFTTLAPCRGTPYHDRAVREIQRMKDDPDQSVRQRYVFINWLAEAPGWQETCKSFLVSANPEERRLAQKCLELGPRPPKRKTYAPK